MSDVQQRMNIRIRRQPLIGSKEALVMNSAKAFYGGKFSEKVGLALVDLLEPLHVAITSGSEPEVQAAISQSLREIRGWHREALNQCRENGYRSSRQVVQQTVPVNCTLENDDSDEGEPELEFD